MSEHETKHDVFNPVLKQLDLGAVTETSMVEKSKFMPLHGSVAPLVDIMTLI